MHSVSTTGGGKAVESGNAVLSLLNIHRKITDVEKVYYNPNRKKEPLRYLAQQASKCLPGCNALALLAVYSITGFLSMFAVSFSFI